MVGDLNCEIEVKGMRKVTYLSFFFIFFFHLFRQSPPENLEIQTAAVTLTLPPSTSHHCALHTTPYTVVLVLS